MKIGLFGFNTAQGLGYVNRDIAKYLGIDRWIVDKHSRFPTLPLIDSVENIVITQQDIPKYTVSEWIKDLDVLLFTETVSKMEYLPELARQLGIKTVCVPMVEWLKKEELWTQHIDIWLAPTAFSYSQLLTLNIPGEIKYCPWPIDTSAFKFRQRNICNQFVYAQGNGGPYDRKGGLLIAQAARIAPEIPIIVYSQVQNGYFSGFNRDVDWPSTIDFRGSTSIPAELYKDGDVFIMPSRFDGIGLQFFECQASGMPLIGTDAPPMNESNPWKRLPCKPSCVNLAYTYASWNVSPESIASIMRKTIGKDISQASQEARDWVVANRDWVVLADYIRSLMV